MQVTETKSEGLSREFKVALPAKDIEEKISFRLNELAKTVSLPGFRPGKVPVAVLRQKYGPSVMGEILEQAVNDSSQQAMAEKGLRPAMQPEIEIDSFEDGKDLEYTISVEILPEITPTDFSKITLERLVPNTNEAEIVNVLENLAKSNGSTNTVSEDRKSKEGDVLMIDFLGRVDGVEFAGGKAEGYELTLGSGTFIPGFEDQLTGTKAGDKVDVKVTFPENYGAAELSGKDAVFEVTVHELRGTEPCAIDDELAKKVGMETLDALKNSIREEQEREFNNMARMTLKRELLDKLADGHDFEVPGKLLEREFDSIWSQFEEQRKAAAESDQPDPEDDGKSDDEQKKDFREIAERRVRLGLLMSEVGRVNNVEISQEDLNKQMMAEARNHPGREQEVFEYFKNNPQAMEQLSAPVYEEKVVDFILEKAKVTDKKAPMDDLIKALETDGDDKPKAKSKAKAKAKPKAKAKTAKKTDK
ncbi:MAG: trigger factor [Alphaproteobacteria bacterium]|nr:trigger factor [Alphaproteobacteria bacterium]